MTSYLVYAGGTVRPADGASEAREAEVLATRDGIFETLLVADGVAVELRAHIDRLLGSAVSVGLELQETRVQLSEAVRSVAGAACRPWASLRIAVYEDAGGAMVMVTAAPYLRPPPSAYARGVKVTLARTLRVRRADKSRQVKSLAWRRQGAALLAAVPDSYDVLLLNDAGRLAEGVRTNVVVQLGGIAMTPSLSEGCLPGTVRSRLVESGAVREGEVDNSEILRGAAMVLTNSLVGVIPVARIDDLTCDVVGLAGQLRAGWEAARR